MYDGCLQRLLENSSLTNIEFDPVYTGVQCYKHPKMFFEYYGDYTYADIFTQAALDGNNTNFSSGRGNADFSLSRTSLSGKGGGGHGRRTPD